MMKKFLVLLCLCFGAMQLHAQNDSVYLFCYFKGNGDGLHFAYSHDGYTWNPMFNDSAILKPLISRDKLFRDPCIIKGGDDKYHMVWTVSWGDKGLGYASSPDLVHWSEQKFIPVMMHEDSARNTWAPEIIFDKKKKQYMVYWASTIAGRFAQKDTSVEGRRYNPRMYSATTKDFEHWSATKLLYDPGFSVIDATIVPQGKQFIMFLKNETKSPVEKNLRIASAKKILGPYSAAGPAITGRYWAEGPTVLQIGKRWVVYFDKYTEKKYGAVASEDFVHWNDISENVSFPKGARHGTALKISRTEFENMRL